MTCCQSWCLQLTKTTLRYRWILALLLFVPALLIAVQSSSQKNYLMYLYNRNTNPSNSNVLAHEQQRYAAAAGAAVDAAAAASKAMRDISVAHVKHAVKEKRNEKAKDKESKKKERPRGRCEDYRSDLSCQPNQPCMYDDVVDFRIIVLTYNRDVSLNQSLHRLADLELDGYTGQIEIWLDCSKDGYVDLNTYQVAKNYHWPHGKARVHVWRSHVGLYGQWMDTWSPRDTDKTLKVVNSSSSSSSSSRSEIALIVEDDLDVSPLAWRWIRTMRETFINSTNIAGYSLKDDNISKKEAKLLDKDGIFLRRHSLPWGFAPEPGVWKAYQEWYHRAYNDTTFHPYIPPDRLHTGWYKNFERRAAAKGHREESMWEQWFYYYMYKHDLLSVFPNARRLSEGKPQKGFEMNRQEDGLHFKGKAKDTTVSSGLITTWDEKYVQVPETLKVVDYSGRLFRNYNIV